MKHEFLMKAFSLDDKVSPAGWFMSEKLNFSRAFWDGGITTGMRKCDVPWANLTKDGRYVHEQIATGLWTQNANVIHAPHWWLETMPRVFLDGELGSMVKGKDRNNVDELIVGRGVAERQRVSSIVKRLGGNERDWDGITLFVFDLPPLEVILGNRTINNIHYKKNLSGCVEWAYRDDMLIRRPMSPFRNVKPLLEPVLRGIGTGCPNVMLIEQEELPLNHAKAMARISEKMFSVLAVRGEGLMLRHPDKPYETCRSKWIRKYKQTQDMEGRVVGHTAGKGKYTGMLGALILEIEGSARGESTVGHGRVFKRVFELSGMTDAKRRNPPPIGCTVTFSYSDLSRDGIPQEARFICVREEE
jgi:hypothetical protein